MAQALFPYVLMRRDPQGRTPIATLSDGIQLALIHVHTDGTTRVMFREELAALDLDPTLSYLASRERLARLVRARLVRMRRVLGPSGVRCLAFEHTFLAASCAVLPNLFDLAQRELEADTMCLAIPRRDLMIVMPNLGPAFRKDMQTLLGIDSGIFSLDPSGPGRIATGIPRVPRVAAANAANLANTAEQSKVAKRSDVVQEIVVADVPNVPLPSNDTMIPVSVDESEITEQTALGEALRPAEPPPLPRPAPPPPRPLSRPGSDSPLGRPRARQTRVVIRKRCA